MLPVSSIILQDQTLFKSQDNNQIKHLYCLYLYSLIQSLVAHILNENDEKQQSKYTLFTQEAQASLKPIPIKV